jgi:hypothetical protein
VLILVILKAEVAELDKLDSNNTWRLVEVDLNSWRLVKGDLNTWTEVDLNTWRLVKVDLNT